MPNKPYHLASSMLCTLCQTAALRLSDVSLFGVERTARRIDYRLLDDPWDHFAVRPFISGDVGGTPWNQKLRCTSLSPFSELP